VGSDPLFFLEQGRLNQEGVLEKVRGVAERVTASRGHEVAGIELHRERGGLLLRLFVDKEGGIGLDELQSVSEEVSVILDAEDLVQERYTLEVSSPGLDRPLRGEQDYRRFLGRLARLSSYELVDGRRHWTGRLEALEDGVITLALEKEGKTARIPLAKVAHARLEIEFPKV
jgi:ribosome maturation factor RimP